MYIQNAMLIANSAHLSAVGCWPVFPDLTLLTHILLSLQRETRRVYAMLCDESEEFNGWKIGPG